MRHLTGAALSCMALFHAIANLFHHNELAAIEFTIEVDGSKIGTNGEIAEVEMTRERYLADPLQAGDLVFVKPRQLRVFLYDNSRAGSPVPMRWSGDGDGI